MNYFQGLTNAIEYVEEHILEAIDFDQASQCAGMSRSSFQRFFLLVADMTFSEYVRKRRMDGAVFDLCNTDERIIYASSNGKIATVTSGGVVKGLRKGTATITVKSGSKKMTCKVTVK